MKKVICSLFALSALSTAVAQEVNIKILEPPMCMVVLCLGVMAQMSLTNPVLMHKLPLM